MQNTSRPPIVVVLGHVDHGKTSLLDAIRKTNVASREAGGITQSIGASVVETKDGGKITFIDTPGHAAFSKMRSRGASLADIAILVVASEDGPKPQTLESIKAIKEAKIPFIVAFTKIDLPSADVETAKAQLEKEEVYFEGRGGETPSVSVSSKTGAGIDELLQTIVLFSEVNEIKASAEAALNAVVIETQTGKSGPLVSVVVRDGTLKVGEEVSTDTVSAKVRGILDDQAKGVKEVLPGYPAQILGFSDLPLIGSEVVAGDVSQAKIQQKPQVSQSTGAEGEIKIFIKAANAGALEALLAMIPPKIAVMGSGVGDVNESDVFLAKSTGSWIFAFEAKIPGSVQKFAETESVKIERFEIIYEFIQRLEELLKKGQIEILGKAQILAIFPFNNRKVAGAKVIEGKIHKANTFLITRSDATIGKSRVASLRKGKQEILEAKAGEEFGAIFDSGLDFAIGDVILATK